MPQDKRTHHVAPHTSGEYSLTGPDAADRPGAIVVLEKSHGSVAMGQVAEKVVFVCFVGELPLELAQRCTRRLRRILGQGSGFALFIDAHAPEGGNLESRSEIMRALVAARPRLSSLVVLVRSEFMRLSAALLGSAFGEGAIITSDPLEFDELLIDAAPYAHETLTTNNCVVAPSSLPPLDIIRSA
jgi:hypothetical protein